MGTNGISSHSKKIPPKTLGTSYDEFIKDTSLNRLIEMKVDSFMGQLSQDSGNGVLQLAVSTVEKCIIENVLKQTKGNQTKTSEILGINRNTLKKKIGSLQLDIKRIKTDGKSQKPPKNLNHIEELENWPPTLL